jgi:serine/threonine protein kinase/predicted Zn-dependent protease
MKGQTVSHYRISDQLGAGGMGVVYAAEDMRLGRRVAVKFLAPDLLQDPQALERFRREARSASSLNHPHICTIYDVGAHGEQQFIVMELLEGQTLRELIKEGRIDVGVLLRLGVQIADALNAAHGRGIVHRDIKPANIYLTSEGTAKILDFGLAKLSNETSQSRGAARSTRSRTGFPTVPGTPVGTINYMSPEQARGEALDTRSDLFSFGAVLYELATRRPAFAGSTDAVVFDAILHRTPVPPSRINPALPPAFDDVIKRALEKDPALRYQTAADLEADLERLRRAPPDSVVTQRKRVARALSWVLPLALAAILAVIWRTGTTPGLAQHDRILLADFVNNTEDPVFDDTLQRAVAYQLEQSPYVNLVPETRVAETLRLMGRAPDERITSALARDICERDGIAVVVSGSITSLGTQYAIHLDATGCRSGESIAREQVQAESKERVLRAVGEAVSRLRRELGESAASIERFDRPIEQVTTPSLPALRAYTLGHFQVLSGHQPEAIPLFKRAIELDPHFALAYARLSTIYHNLNMTEPAAEAARQAIRRADRVSEREKLYITQRYHSIVTGDLDQYRDTLEIFRQTYPRDPVPLINLGVLSAHTGQFGEAVRIMEEARRLHPTYRAIYDNLADYYRTLNRFDDAAAILHEQVKHTRETAYTHYQLFTIFFVQGDTRRRDAEWQWLRDKNDVTYLERIDSNLARSAGRLREAREIAERAAERDLARDDRRGAAFRLTSIAVHSALAGNAREAQRLANRAVALAPTPATWESASFPLALAGDAARATQLLEQCLPHFPTQTQYKSVYLPVDRAAIALARGDAAAALEALRPAAAYELGDWAEYWVVYLRGVAYLRLGAARESLAEFEKILKRPGLYPFNIAIPLAHLYEGRAAALAGDMRRSMAAYDRFLELWKNADPDLPVVREAIEERSRIRADQGE